MPEDAELAFVALSLFEGFYAFVDTDKLMVLSDDFLCFVVVDNEVFEVVEQFGRVAEAINSSFYAGACVMDLFTVYFFFFVFYT